ncbi:MAG: DUF433 domain-containing protein [Chloroflexota bacterium]
MNTQHAGRTLLGRYVVVDPAICHGQPTFVGTRVLVADVLEQVAMGMAWEAIGEEWGGRVQRDAIAEAVSLARSALLAHPIEQVGISLAE